MYRRDFLKQGSAVIAGAATATGLISPAFANRHAHPHEGSLDYLDPETYINNMTMHLRLNEKGFRGGKMQMWARGSRRVLFHNRGYVVDISDPLKPEMIAQRAYPGGQIQLAYNNKIRKWILMMGHGAPSTSTDALNPNGKYDDPGKITISMNAPGLRGVRFYDATDPSDIKLLSEWSCDQGDPGREVQTGGGTHRNYYDGGKYAYLDCGPDNSFIHMESPVRYYTNCMQIIDAEDPEKPKVVSNWWFPGQRAGEERSYRRWREFGDHLSFTSSHGPFYVPKKVEDGGKYAYGAYGSFGITIHDVSDPANPKLVGRWRPPYLPGAIPFHTVDISRLGRGFVVGSAETLNPDCFEPYHDNYVVDVRDPANPKVISTMPRWEPPESAPYDDFCDKRGRYGTHNPAHLKAPGKVDPNFTAYGAFNAGIQTMDISDPANTRITGWFIPPSAGDLNRFGSFNRIGESMFIEWDRRLIWGGCDSGVYLLSHPDLGDPILKPMEVETWAVPGLNEGHG